MAEMQRLRTSPQKQTNKFILSHTQTLQKHTYVYSLPRAHHVQRENAIYNPLFSNLIWLPFYILDPDLICEFYR